MKKRKREYLYLTEENYFFLQRIVEQTTFNKSEIVNFALEYFKENFHKIFLDRKKRMWYDLSK